MTLKQVATLYKYPEEALACDLVYLIFFNRDIPSNHSLRFVDGTHILAYTSKGWRSTHALDVLRVVAAHFKKVMEFCKARCEDIMSNVDHMKVSEYLRAISSGNDIHVSPNCPIFPHIEDGVISVDRMVRTVTHSIMSGSQWPKDEWPQTVMYAKSNIFDDDNDGEF